MSSETFIFVLIGVLIIGIIYTWSEITFLRWQVGFIEDCREEERKQAVKNLAIIEAMAECLGNAQKTSMIKKGKKK